MSELVPTNFIMEGELHELKADKCSVLLELAAIDDLVAFKSEVEEQGLDLAGKLLVCVDVLKYILRSGKADVNGACGTDGVTALHCAVAGGSNSSVEIVKLLLDARKVIELLLQGDDVVGFNPKKSPKRLLCLKWVPRRKSILLMYRCLISTMAYMELTTSGCTFKVKPCSRAYSHDWTECPFVHPGENARRRDPRKYPYSCVPCPEFRKGACPKGDACEYAHGVFESWLHPAQYRTRLCKDEVGCTRKVCFFAHKHEELRQVYASTGSAMPSPRSAAVNVVDMATLSPLALGSSSLPLPTASTQPMFPLTALPLRRMEAWTSNSPKPTPCKLSNQPSILSSEESFTIRFDSSAAVAAAVMNSRSSAFAKRSQSLIDRGDELNKLKKSASFAFRNNTRAATMIPSDIDEPDVSWVNSLVKDVTPMGGRSMQQQYNIGKGVRERLPPWVEQCIEQEQM
ncbi:2-oxoglutarate (2OG) and Fe(II)-dependent oxygenase superfamily protein [Hibiscus syriacus]|uniref:2-oxoglutarate (2OG) and Fe(II)-dependent oxygenase superfamily protein n=1 Tax=Hibiscus syriacus TaxID=106335 RepID=A0A6A2ZU88_HIBSY|nr:2-oxoglutarate (2OG) and Fe(II)-dependent oxygenase superfamily protein [Hibiscus syriacus]